VTGYLYRGQAGLDQANASVLADRARRPDVRKPRKTTYRQERAIESAASRKRRYGDQAAADVLAILKLLAARMQ